MVKCPRFEPVDAKGNPNFNHEKVGAERVTPSGDPSATNRRSRPARSSYAARGSGAGGCARPLHCTLHGHYVYAINMIILIR